MPLPAEHIRATQEDGVLTLTLNNPSRRNAMDEAMLDILIAQVDRARDDATVRLIVLRGEGEFFCAGADLKTDEGIQVTGLRTLDKANALIESIVGLKQPTLAVVQGVAAGVGCSFALACDLVIADHSASFLLAFTRIGLMPDGGATALVPASIGRARAMRMAMLAEPMAASQAFDCGLISHLAADSEFDAEVETLVTRLSTGPTAALGETKAAINAATLPNLSGALATEKEGQIRLLPSQDLEEGVAAFVEKRKAAFVGA